jgi:hypothetical protein
LILTRRGNLYNQMNHLSDGSASEIGGHLLEGIEFIGLRDFRASANVPICVGNVGFTRKKFLEL